MHNISNLQPFSDRISIQMNETLFPFEKWLLVGTLNTYHLSVDSVQQDEPCSVPVDLRIHGIHWSYAHNLSSCAIKT